MRRHLAYLRYVVIHKWFVFLECLKLGVPIWNAVFHDWTKFRPSEWLPYARFFHNPDGSKKQKQSATGYKKPDDTGVAEFETAIGLHYARNKHHWEHYYNKDTGECKPMSDGFIREMVADWRGAGRAQGTPDTCRWYEVNYNRIQLDWDTRMRVEYYLDYRHYVNENYHLDMS